jgi:putative phosphoesterase
MRVLVVADIHANWPALRSLSEPHDVCLCIGDLVDYALEPAPCIDWVRRHAHFAVRGNHDHGVAQDIRVNGRNGFKYLSGVTRAVTRDRLGAEDLRFLANLPVTKVVTINELRILLVHATPRDPLDEYAPADLEFWTRRLRDVDADVICVGHTHQPYVMEVGSKLVVNPGSIGQPRDGDPRGAYAVIENRRVELKRVEYPVEETVRVIQESPLSDHAKLLLTEVFRTGRTLQKSDNNKMTPDNNNAAIATKPVSFPPV